MLNLIAHHPIVTVADMSLVDIAVIAKDIPQGAKETDVVDMMMIQMRMREVIRPIANVRKVEWKMTMADLVKISSRVTSLMMMVKKRKKQSRRE